MRKVILWMLFAVMLLSLTGCAALDGLSRSDAQPDLRLITPPAYEEPVIEAIRTPDEESGAFRLDLWLDASQTMGGINPNTESVYPHASYKYREGGFHYRFENTVGMYETVLRCMLSGAEGSRVRLLRYGSERLPDAFLMEQGVAASSASAEELRSLRRDMLTYAIDPMPDIFSGFSGEKMTDSFYSPGSPQLNRMETLNASLLENPELQSQMAAALDTQIRRIQKGDSALLVTADDSDYPLLYALNHLDLNRLSVVVFDPASVRRLTAVQADGTPAALVQNLMNDRGVFDAGLCAGLYAFTLDYMGQMPSFASADLSEPLLWGRLDYNQRTGIISGPMAMPRTLLALVIGRPAQVASFTSAFENHLAASSVLRELRGPKNGELTYTSGGKTIAQEPFSFDYDYTLIQREKMEVLNQHTQGVILAGEDVPVSLEGHLYTAALAPVDGVQPDRTLTLAFPFSDAPGGMTLDCAGLENVELTVQSALILSDVLPNHPDTQIPEHAQTIVLRDKIYVFTQQDVSSPVACTGVSASPAFLTAELSVNGSMLMPGYYRIAFSADLSDESMQWETPAWVSLLNANITNEQISAWETFTGLLAKHERKRTFISKAYQHAWGGADNDVYFDMPVPDFPPVMKAPGLAALVSQLQTAAHPGSMPYIRYVFDLFVTAQP